jgi:predicted dehydrogenase
MWFIPAIIKAKALINAGEIGEPQTLIADFGFYAPFDPHRRLFAPELGGGALLDIGIYPLALALYLFGKPDAVSGASIMGQTGVDEQITMALRYADGRIANCTATYRANTPCEAIIAGSEGYLRIHRDFWYSERLSLVFHHKHNYSIEMPLQGNGYEHEIAETMQCIRAGKLQSDVMSWQASLDLMWMMDTLRADWGLRYPGE